MDMNEFGQVDSMSRSANSQGNNAAWATSAAKWDSQELLDDDSGASGQLPSTVSHVFVFLF